MSCAVNPIGLYVMTMIHLLCTCVPVWPSVPCSHLLQSYWDLHCFTLPVSLSLSPTGLCCVWTDLLLQGNDSAWSAAHSAPCRPRRQQQVWCRDTLPYHTELTLQTLKTPGPNRPPYPSPSDHPSISSSPSLILPHLRLKAWIFFVIKKRPDNQRLWVNWLERERETRLERLIYS